jgi:hypothetical protein
VLPSGTIEWVSRDAQLASFFANPQRALELDEKALRTKGDRELLPLIGYLATHDDRVPEHVLDTLGIWRTDVEDIDS